MHVEPGSPFESHLVVARRCARRAGVCAVLIATSAASVAAAETSYPPSLERDAVFSWLQQATDVAPEQVVALSPSAATAVVSRVPAGAKVTTVVLRAQALTPEAVARSGVLAWEMRLEVDCRTGKVRAGATMGFTERRLVGEGLPLAPQEAAWRQPNPGTALQSAWRAVCDPRFAAPLATPGLQATSAPVAEDILPALRPALPGPSSRLLVAVSRPMTPGSGASAQVVSSTQDADARSTLAAVRKRFPGVFAGRETLIEPAQVRGRTVYRGLVVGFETHGEASAFCEALKRGGQDCVAR